MTQGGPVCRTPHTYERKLSTSKLRYKGGQSSQETIDLWRESDFSFF